MEDNGQNEAMVAQVALDGYRYTANDSEPPIKSHRYMATDIREESSLKAPANSPPAIPRRFSGIIGRHHQIDSELMEIQ